MYFENYSYRLRLFKNWFIVKMLQQSSYWQVSNCIVYFAGQHMRLLEQENRVLWWVCPLSSVRDVGDGGQSGLWSHYRWHQGTNHNCSWTYCPSPNVNLTMCWHVLLLFVSLVWKCAFLFQTVRTFLGFMKIWKIRSVDSEFVGVCLELHLLYLWIFTTLTTYSKVAYNWL